jgi:hypothetical protein
VKLRQLAWPTLGTPRLPQTASQQASIEPRPPAAAAACWPSNQIGAHNQEWLEDLILRQWASSSSVFITASRPTRLEATHLKGWAEPSQAGRRNRIACAWRNQVSKASEPVRRALVNLDALASKQEADHIDVSFLRRQDERRATKLVGLVHIAPLAEQPRHELRVASLSCGPQPGGGVAARHAVRAPARARARACAPTQAPARQGPARPAPLTRSSRHSPLPASGGAYYLGARKQVQRRRRPSRSADEQEQRRPAPDMLYVVGLGQGDKKDITVKGLWLGDKKDISRSRASRPRIGPIDAFDSAVRHRRSQHGAQTTKVARRQ